MPSFTKAHLKDDAVLWTKTGNYSDDGKVLLNSAVAIKVRWEQKSGEFISPDGATIGYDDVVYVNQEIEEGSIMWKGKLEDLPSPNSSITDLRQVIKYEGIPDVKGRVQMRRVILMKHSDSLPTVS